MNLSDLMLMSGNKGAFECLLMSGNKGAKASLDRMIRVEMVREISNDVFSSFSSARPPISAENNKRMCSQAADKTAENWILAMSDKDLTHALFFRGFDVKFFQTQIFPSFLKKHDLYILAGLHDAICKSKHAAVILFKPCNGFDGGVYFELLKIFIKYDIDNIKKNEADFAKLFVEELNTDKATPLFAYYNSPTPINPQSYTF